MGLQWHELWEDSSRQAGDSLPPHAIMVLATHPAELALLGAPIDSLYFRTGNRFAQPDLQSTKNRVDDQHYRI